MHRERSYCFTKCTQWSWNILVDFYVHSVYIDRQWLVMDKILCIKFGTQIQGVLINRARGILKKLEYFDVIEKQNGILTFAQLFLSIISHH